MYPSEREDVTMAYCANCGTVEDPDKQFCATCGAATSGPFAAPAPLPYFPMDGPALVVEPNLAGFWWRVLGFIIDSILLALVTTLPAHQFGVNFYAGAILAIVVGFFYWFLLIAFWGGATIGMRVASIRCVDMNGRGPVGPRQAAIRSAFYSALVAVGSLYHYTTYAHPTAAQSKLAGEHVAIAFCLSAPHLLELLWAAWDKKNQTLHDKVAGTIVIRDDKSLSQSRATPSR
jgi:uncharacterized RDD family membrane protein YckC